MLRKKLVTANGSLQIKWYLKINGNKGNEVDLSDQAELAKQLEKGHNEGFGDTLKELKEDKKKILFTPSITRYPFLIELADRKKENHFKAALCFALAATDQNATFWQRAEAFTNLAELYAKKNVKKLKNLEEDPKAALNYYQYALAYYLIDFSGGGFQKIPETIDHLQNYLASQTTITPSEAGLVAELKTILRSSDLLDTKAITDQLKYCSDLSETTLRFWIESLHVCEDIAIKNKSDNNKANYMQFLLNEVKRVLLQFHHSKFPDQPIDSEQELLRLRLNAEAIYAKLAKKINLQTIDVDQLSKIALLEDDQLKEKNTPPTLEELARLFYEKENYCYALYYSLEAYRLDPQCGTIAQRMKQIELLQSDTELYRFSTHHLLPYYQKCNREISPPATGDDATILNNKLKKEGDSKQNLKDTNELIQKLIEFFKTIENFHRDCKILLDVLSEKSIPKESIPVGLRQALQILTVDPFVEARRAFITSFKPILSQQVSDLDQLKKAYTTYSAQIKSENFTSTLFEIVSQSLKGIEEVFYSPLYSQSLNALHLSTSLYSDSNKVFKSGNIPEMLKVIQSIEKTHGLSNKESSLNDYLIKPAQTVARIPLLLGEIMNKINSTEHLEEWNITNNLSCNAKSAALHCNHMMKTNVLEQTEFLIRLLPEGEQEKLWAAQLSEGFQANATTTQHTESKSTHTHVSKTSSPNIAEVPSQKLQTETTPKPIIKSPSISTQTEFPMIEPSVLIESQNKVANLSEQIENQKRELHASQSSQKEWETVLANKNQENESLNHQLQQLQQSLNGLKTKLEQENAGFSQERKSSTDKLKQLQADLDQAETHHSHQQTLIQDLQDKVQTSIQEQDRYQQEVNRLQNQLSQLQKQLELSQITFQEQNKEIQRIKPLEEENQTLTSELHSADEQLSTTKGEITQLTNKVTELTQDVAASKEENLAHSKTDVESKKDQKALSQQNANIIAELTRENAKLTGENVRLGNLNQDLQDTYDKIAKPPSKTPWWVYGLLGVIIIASVALIATGVGAFIPALGIAGALAIIGITKSVGIGLIVSGGTSLFASSASTHFLRKHDQFVQKVKKSKKKLQPPYPEDVSGESSPEENPSPANSPRSSQFIFEGLGINPQNPDQTQHPPDEEKDQSQSGAPDLNHMDIVSDPLPDPSSVPSTVRQPVSKICKRSRPC